MPETELTLTAEYEDTSYQADKRLGHFGWIGGIELRSIRLAGVDVQAHELPARLVAAIEQMIGEMI